MKKQFLFLILLSLVLSIRLQAATATCINCGGNGQVMTVVGYDMFYNPCWGWARCLVCGGAGVITIPEPQFNTNMPVFNTGTFYPTSTYVAPSSGSSSSTSSYSESTQSTTRRCGKCQGSGWYTCPCEKTPSFGLDQGSHQCTNCGEIHNKGTHSCQCRSCGGNGYK